MENSISFINHFRAEVGLMLNILQTFCTISVISNERNLMVCLALMMCNSYNALYRLQNIDFAELAWIQ